MLLSLEAYVGSEVQTVAASALLRNSLIIMPGWKESVHKVLRWRRYGGVDGALMGPTVVKGTTVERNASVFCAEGYRPGDIRR